MTDSERRRRRLRHDPSGGAGGQPGEGRRGGPDAGNGTGNGDDRDAERGLRGLIGSGASQVSVAAAMRARDAARPTDADLAEAAERLVLVRRNWVPRDELPRGGR
ncbi:hypothetical protein [Plantactinospora endophytica]|uniref:ANTAR domain-containing protein n=1 Tax=Plantactinospora endophytica TaxID=673535 RepID=A0ABQ4EB81_9ACTN|nr:hypothetical protein [Plantactinospora endophytica]GIG91963.1 hypothetical protein Pen02_68990 [Plantactinospora endophytica]